MNVLSYLQENQMLTRLKDASSDQVKHAFFSNYLAALVMLKLQDIDGLHMINDPQSANLTKFKDKMSDINFWGRVLFHSDVPEVKQRMMFGHSEALKQASGRIVTSRVQSIMKIPLQNPEQINWNEVVATLVLLKHRFSVSSSYLTNLMRYLYTWEKLSSSGRRKAVNDSFMYLVQSDPRSALAPRVRALSNSVMINSVDGLVSKLVGFKRLAEEDGGGSVATGTGNVASGDSGVGNNLIVTPPQCDDNHLGGLYRLEKKSPNQVTKKSKVVIKDGKIIKKKRKAFTPRKFKLPDYLRAQKSVNKETE